MSGVKGRSGGPRDMPKIKSPEVYSSDPRQFLRAILTDPSASLAQRIDAAKALLNAERRQGDPGKKKEKAHEAEKASEGRFRAIEAPLRSVSKG